MAIDLAASGDSTILNEEPRIVGIQRQACVHAPIAASHDGGRIAIVVRD